MKAIGPGDVVVCVDASDIAVCQPLSEGSRYIIRTICLRGPARRDGVVVDGVRLRGIINPLDEYGREDVYDIRRFRPIDDGDSAIFREMIVPIKKKHRVPAHG